MALASLGVKIFYYNFTKARFTANKLKIVRRIKSQINIQFPLISF